jgi:hypothetical protein
VTRLLYMMAGLCAAALFTACAKPTYTFVTNSDDHLYFKVPASWSEIKQRDLDKFASPGLDDASAAALRAQTWTVAFDAGDKPSIAHVFSPQVKAPVVFARVLRSTNGDSTNITLDALRDFFLPVTKTARLTARATGQEIPGFRSIVDYVMSREGGLTGVHEVFRYKVSGVMQTFDQTALVTKDASRVYILLVRCTQACYADRQSELATVVRSFIVKSGP